MKERTEKTLTGLELKLKNLKQTTSPFKTFINKEVPMLENIVKYYKEADGKTKKKILGCIFSEKLTLEKGKVATYPRGLGDKTHTTTSQCQQGFHLTRNN